jgi:hypothetical protein
MLSSRPVANPWPRPRRGKALERVLLAALGLVAATVAACGPGAEDIAEARTRYVAAADGFVVRQEPAGDGLKQDVVLGVALRRSEAGKDGEAGMELPGVTLDVEQVGAAGASRRRWRLWTATAGLAPGRDRRIEHVLEGVDYLPGDTFRVEVRASVPAGERAAYREWSATDSGLTS